MLHFLMLSDILKNSNFDVQSLNAIRKFYCYQNKIGCYCHALYVLQWITFIYTNLKCKFYNLKACALQFKLKDFQSNLFYLTTDVIESEFISWQYFAFFEPTNFYRDSACVVATSRISTSDRKSNHFQIEAKIEQSCKDLVFAQLMIFFE